MSHQQTPIFDKSACLSKKQMQAYISGALSTEEVYAVEMHLASCPFCSDAIDGMLMLQEDTRNFTLNNLNDDFLKDHLQQIAQTAAQETRKANSNNRIQLYRKAGAVAAGLLLCFAVAAYINTQYQNKRNDTLAHKASKAGETDAAATPPPPTDVAHSITFEEAAPESKELPKSATDSKETGKTLPAAKATLPATEKENKGNYYTGKAKEQEEVSVAHSTPSGEAKSTVVPAEETARRSSKDDNVQQAAEKMSAAGKKYSFETTAASGNSIRLNDDKASKKKADNKAYPVPDLKEAQSLYNQGSYNQALEMSRQLLEEDAGNADLLLLSAKSHIRLGNKRKAKRILNQLIDNNSRHKAEAQKLLEQMNDKK